MEHEKASLRGRICEHARAGKNFEHNKNKMLGGEIESLKYAGDVSGIWSPK